LPGRLKKEGKGNKWGLKGGAEKKKKKAVIQTKANV